jgi:hypothetical protein
MADTSTWRFGEGSNFHVGPIVGRVTDTTARIVIEAAHDLTAEISVSADDEPVPDGGAAVTGTGHHHSLRGAMSTMLKHHHKNGNEVSLFSYNPTLTLPLHAPPRTSALQTCSCTPTHLMKFPALVLARCKRRVQQKERQLTRCPSHSVTHAT